MVARTPNTAKVEEALAASVDALGAAGVDSPRLDAEVLLAAAIGCDRTQLLARPETALPAGAGRAFGEMVRRRLRREPVAYIVGRKGFRRIELAVARGVLVPRPETELLVEVALGRRPRRVLDVGTGSGAIALAIADELPECEVVATDASAGALDAARANAARLGLADRVSFLLGALPGDDLEPGGEPGASGPAAEFDLLVANLPYIPDGDWPTLPPEVRDWEPREALLAGPDGLDAYRALLRRVRPSSPIAAMSANSAAAGAAAGAIALEVGVGQAAAVAELVRAAGFDGVEVRRDLAGIERVVLGAAAGAGGDGAASGGER